MNPIYAITAIVAIATVYVVFLALAKASARAGSSAKRELDSPTTDITDQAMENWNRRRAPRS